MSLCLYFFCIGSTDVFNFLQKLAYLVKYHFYLNLKFSAKVIFLLGISARYQNKVVILRRFIRKIILLICDEKVCDCFSALRGSNVLLWR